MEGHLSRLSQINPCRGSCLPQVPSGRTTTPRTGLGRCSGHTCVFIGGGRAAPPRRVRAATATHARRSALTVTPAAPSRVERGARGSDGSWRAGARHPGRLCSSAALPEQLGLGRRATAARVRASSRQVVAGRRGMRDALPPPSARLPVSGHRKAEGAGRRTSWGGAGRRPLE